MIYLFNRTESLEGEFTTVTELYNRFGFQEAATILENQHPTMAANDDIQQIKQILNRSA